MVDFRKKNICSKEECERLLSFINNSGPLFILGSVGNNMFGNRIIGVLLLVSHILGSITVGMIFRFWKKKEHTKIEYNNISKNENKLQNINISNIGYVLTESIKSAISNILMIGGFIILFSVIISIFSNIGFNSLIKIMCKPIDYKLNLADEFYFGFFNGLLEITNGINIISLVKIKKISINLICTSFLLGWGGICVFLQIFSIVSKSDISMKPYLIGKLLHGVFSAIYTFFLIQILPFFNFNL